MVSKYYNSYNPYSVCLTHSGVKGMKWGERRWQNEDGTWTEAGKIRRRVGHDTVSIGNIERPHTDYNLDKWGSSKDTNILWVTGLPGSGKSSIANNIAKKHNADVVNMDLYTFKTADKYVSQMSKGFNAYLNKNVPDWKDKQKKAYEVLTKNDRRKAKAAGEWFDTFEEALKGYGSQMYGNKKVIAEGVQLLDETLFYNNKEALSGQPLIVVNTSVTDSLKARMNRDNKSIEKLLEPERFRQLNTFITGKDDIERIMSHSALMHYDVGSGYGPRKGAYSSPYYNYEKAHAYYEAHKQLKGRSTALLNDEGKIAWAYVKNNINEEKKAKIAAGQNETKAAIASLQEQIKALRTMSANERTAKRAEIQNRIQTLRQQLKVKRQELQAQLKAKSEAISKEKSQKSADIRERNKSASEYVRSINASESEKVRQEKAKRTEDISKEREKARAEREKRSSEIAKKREQLSSTTDKEQKAKIREEIAKMSAENKNANAKLSEDISKMAADNRLKNTEASLGLQQFKQGNSEALAATRAANSEELAQFREAKTNEMAKYRAKNRAEVQSASQATSDAISNLRTELSSFNEQNRAVTNEQISEIRNQITALREANKANRELINQETENTLDSEFGRIASAYPKEDKKKKR